MLLTLSDHDPFSYSIINITSSSDDDDDHTKLIVEEDDISSRLKQDNHTDEGDGDGDGDGDDQGSMITQSCFACQPTYGFLPCTDSVLGNLFLLATYAYLIFVAGRLVSKGSEYLLTVLDAGLVGGLVLPILAALPDAILILGMYHLITPLFFSFPLIQHIE